MNDYRLFPGCEQSNISKEDINKLIAEMSANSRNTNLSNILAGFTYLGQMIAHDIVKSTNNPNGRKINKASMMLESIYGDECFNEQNDIFNSYGHFKFSDPVQCNDIRCENLDLFRKDGKVIIPEKRNDENFLVSQLHLFWQRLHNKILTNLNIGNNCGLKKKNNKHDKIEFAKEMVIKLFQQVVIEDYLYNILDLETYLTYIDLLKSGSKDLFFYLDKDDMDEVPLEFSHAVFRFGHSMVRNSYEVSKGKVVDLKDLFNIHHCPIHVNFLVNWFDFFGIGNLDVSTIKSFRIDDVIVNPMQEIPNKNPIIQLNLEAGFKSNLPSGFQLLDHILTNHKDAALRLKLDTKEYSNIVGNIKCKVQNSYSCINFEDTPLWLYILIEADLTSGNTLGKLGSAIVAEVIIKSIQQADISILNNNETIFDLEIANRANLSILNCPMSVEQVFQTIVNDNRRFTMIDLLNFANKI
jgi:hypothetical protein